MYMAPACSMWLLLGCALVEWPRMSEENALGLIAVKPGLYMTAAAMGFGVNSLAYIVIQLASSLTLKACPRWKPRHRNVQVLCVLLLLAIASRALLTSTFGSPACSPRSTP